MAIAVPAALAKLLTKPSDFAARFVANMNYPIGLTVNSYIYSAQIYVALRACSVSVGCFDTMLPCSQHTFASDCLSKALRV